jgi:signal transduction histidine kinase
MAAMVFQNTHRFRNTIQRLRIRRDHILDAPDDVARNNAIDELTEPIETAIQLVDRPMNLAERILNPAYARQQLSSLVKQVLPHCSDQFAPPIELSMTVPEDVIVLADREQVVEAFRNIVDNAFQAMPAGGILSVTAGRTLDRKRVSIIFEDTGIGMTEEEKKGAMTGFFSTKGHKGVGVLLTSVLIAAQGGTVDIQSAKGMGTKVTIMLPSPKVED